MSYQTQQYGQGLAYLIEIFKNLEHVEEFIVIKSLFLALQILFEVRVTSPALAIIKFLEVKLKDCH